MNIFMKKNFFHTLFVTFIFSAVLFSFDVRCSMALESLPNPQCKIKHFFSYAPDIPLSGHEYEVQIRWLANPDYCTVEFRSLTPGKADYELHRNLKEFSESDITFLTQVDLEIKRKPKSGCCPIRITVENPSSETRRVMNARIRENYFPHFQDIFAIALGLQETKQGQAMPALQAMDRQAEMGPLHWGMFSLSVAAFAGLLFLNAQK
jgi:hypothetical protein